MSTGVSTFVIRWINLLTMFVALGVIGFGVWISTHHDGCRKSLTLPVLGLGALIFVISTVGFLEQLYIIMDVFDHALLNFVGNPCFYRIGVEIKKSEHFRCNPYLCFIITNNGTGHNVAGLRFKEYRLQDYNKWFLKELNNSHNWKRLQSCLVKADDCSNLSKRYKTLKQYKSAKLTHIEAGCCRPPSQCGYPAVNASYYDLSFHPVSPVKDCKLYKSSKATKCYNCDSCKAAVAEYMKTEWRVVAIFNVVLFVVVSVIYFVGCCARRNAASSHSKC